MYWIKFKLDKLLDHEGTIKLIASQSYLIENWLAIRDFRKISLANNEILSDMIRFRDLKLSYWSRIKTGQAIAIGKLLIDLKKVEDEQKCSGKHLGFKAIS